MGSWLPPGTPPVARASAGSLRGPGAPSRLPSLHTPVGPGPRSWAFLPKTKERLLLPEPAAPASEAELPDAGETDVGARERPLLWAPCRLYHLPPLETTSPSSGGGTVPIKLYLQDQTAARGPQRAEPGAGDVPPRPSGLDVSGQPAHRQRQACAGEPRSGLQASVPSRGSPPRNSLGGAPERACLATRPGPGHKKAMWTGQ